METVQLAIGVPVFFARTADLQRINLYGIIIGRSHGRWRAQLQNGSHTITFDPSTGLARLFGVEERLVLILSPSEVHAGEHYQDVIERAQALYESLADPSDMLPVNGGVNSETNMTQLSLGIKARDLSTGLLGTITSRVHRLSGSVQYTLQPYNDSGVKMEDSYNVDEGYLEFVDKHLRDKAASEQEPLFTLGSKLEDTVSGAVGIAVAYHVYFNGCLFYALERPIDATKEKSLKYDDRVIYAPQQQLKQIKKAPTVSTASARPQGGPSQRVAAQPATRI